MNRKYNDTEIIELHSLGLTDKEIAETIGVSSNNLARKRKRLGLEPNKSSREKHKLTDYELSILVGTILGDSCVRYVHSKCKYPSLTFTHCVQQEEYFLWKVDKLNTLISSWNKYVDNSKFSKSGYKFQCVGKNMKCLVDIYNIFYPNNAKHIPITFIEKFFTEISLYCLYMDDGSYDRKGNSYILNTQCFTKDNLQEFTHFLNVKFGLYFNIKSDNSLYLQHESNEIFEEILCKYNECNTMTYKYNESHR